MTGNAPRVTLTPDKTSYNDGDPIRVAVAVSDADTTTETIHGGPDALGRADDITIVRTDTAVITSAFWVTSGDPAAVSGMVVTGTAHVGSGPLQVAVRDAQGNTTTATLTMNVSSTMMLGSDRTPIDMTMFPAQTYTRLYSPPTRGIHTLSGLAAGIVPHVSFKDAVSSTLVNPWLNTVTRPVIMEWNHEPEGDMPISTYRAGVTLLQQLVRAHPNGHLVRVAQTFTRYAQVHGKTGPDGLAATWKAMWVPGSDLIGFDCEIDRQYPGYPVYPDPKSFFSVAVAASIALGVPFLVPELGWPLLPGDTGSAGLAAWYAACAAYLHTVNCAGAAAYDTLGSTGDYRLSGAPLAAWQKAVSGR